MCAYATVEDFSYASLDSSYASLDPSTWFTTYNELPIIATAIPVLIISVSLVMHFVDLFAL